MTLDRGRVRLLPALLAGGIGLASAQAVAVQLADIEVQSALGQPLRASIAFALSPNEQLYSYCIYLNPGAGSGGLPTVETARISISDGRINIVGRTPVREPILALNLSLDCPYTANLTRGYTIMLDPIQARAPDLQPRTQAASADRRRVNEQPTQPGVAPSDAPIGPTGSYRVRVGDSLSTIAARIENRPIGLWAAVDQLFVANPDAFIGGDMNRLKAGSLLMIPSFDGVTAAVVGNAPAAAIDTTAESAQTGTAGSESAADVAMTDTAYPGFAVTGEASTRNAPQALEDMAASDGAVEPIAPIEAVIESRPEADASADQTLDLQPGDVLLGDDRTFVSPIDSTSGERAAVAEPVTTADTRAADDGPAPSAAREPRTGIYWWLVGGGLAVILGLLWLVRGRRKLPQRAPAAALPEHTIADDDPTAENRALPQVDYVIGEDSMAAGSAPSLDADLSAGTGLSGSADIEVAQDFGFSTTRDLGSDLDMLSPGGADRSVIASPTDVIPPHRFGEDTILEREILPSDDDDEYDLSMIVDATKQPFGDGDVTAKDLKAVPVQDVGADDEVDEYTLSKDIDYEVLEQDYEAELTSTQMLNAEITKAAVDLADRLDEADDQAADEDTAEIEAAAEDDADATSELTREERTLEMDVQRDAAEPQLSDLDDTGVNEALTEELQRADVLDDTSIDGTFEGTAKLPAKWDDEASLRQSGAHTDLTAELPAAENDPTVEMDVETGRFKSKKSGS